MNLNVFIEKGKEDSNLFWRLSSGEHQNLLDEAIEKLEIAEANNQSGETNVNSFLEIIKRIEHDEILCHCPLCKLESYNKRFIWSISETIKLIKKNC